MERGESAKKYYLTRRDAGSSKRLVGDVISIVFFLNDKNSKWTDAAKKKYLKSHNEAVLALQKQGRDKKVNLSFRVANCELNVDCDCTIHNYHEVSKAILKALCSASVEDYKAFYKGKYPCDEVPLTFVLNKSGRSFAYAAGVENPYQDEYSVVFSNGGNFSVRSIMHEMLHQFGAVDYYYPKKVFNQANSYFPDSIMNIGYENQRNVDDFSAYLIGWKDTILVSTSNFLNSIADVTYGDIIDGRNHTIKYD